MLPKETLATLDFAALRPKRVVSGTVLNAYLPAMNYKAPLSTGSWVSLFHPSIIEVMSRAGFDWLVVDMEHSVIDFMQAQIMIATIQAQGLQAYVRVGENNRRIIKRVLDAGADGIIVPMVNSYEEAVEAVEAVKYPPVGQRGVGLARAQGYGVGDGFATYRDGKAKEIKLIAQIEHHQAIDELDGIIGLDGIDGTLIGPYDLSGSMGKPGQYEDDDVIAALRRYEIVANANPHKLMGFHVVDLRPEAFRDKVDKGYNFIAYGIDALFLGEACRTQLAAIRAKIANDRPL